MCTHTHTCTHTDWACNACSDFGFLFLTLSLQSVHVHECTHMCTAHTHTQTGLVPLAVTLGSYFSHCLYKAYMCMNVHTCAHTHAHTHTHTETGLVPLAEFLQSVHVHELTHIHTCAHTHSTTCSDFGFLFLTLSLFSQSTYMCMNVHTCAHTLLCTQPVHHIFVTHTAHTHTVHLHCYGHGILCTKHTYTHVQYPCTHAY